MKKITTISAKTDIKQFSQFKETPTQYQLTPLFKLWLRLFGKKKVTIYSYLWNYRVKTSTIIGYYYNGLFYITKMQVK